MDSITHIIVGAAAGQLIAGRKYGMRPMIWGAIGGSFPDIDVISGFWLNPVESVLAHRGFTHSILCMMFISPLLAYLVVKFYEKKIQLHKGFRFFISSFLLIVALLTGFLFNLIFYSTSIFLFIPFLIFTIWAGFKVLRIFRGYVVEEPQAIEVKFKDAWLIFFLTLCTHLFLDSCTAYGTGLFEPFTHARVSFNNISVADIFFTIPAAILLIIGIIRYKNFLFIKLSLFWCGVYLAFTGVNAAHINSVFTQSLDKQQIKVSQKIVSPSILNNFLWYTVAEGDTAFYFAQYSLFDKEAKVNEFIPLPKAWNLLSQEDFKDKDIGLLNRFSQGYYNLCKDDKGKLQWNDLRFGFMGKKQFTASDYIFKFNLEKNNAGWIVKENSGPQKPISEIWPVFWQRVWGK